MKQPTKPLQPDHGNITHVFNAPNLEQLTCIIEACVTLRVPFTVYLLKYDGNEGQYPRFAVVAFETRGDADV